MSEALEEIAAQNSLRVNEARNRRGGKGYRFNISPNLEHAHVPHEPKPIAISIAKDIPPAAIPIFVTTLATSYTELIGGIQARIGELGIRQVDFDDLAGFAPGLTGKVFGPAQVKRLGPEKMFDALRAAGLKLRLEADPDQLERMRKQIAENCQPRQAKQARMGNRSHLSNSIIDEVLSYLANNRKGGLARLNKAVKQARSNHARRTIAIGVNWAQQRAAVGFTALLALPPPESRETLDSCAEEEATAA
jgi:hypothetical protein